MTFCRSIYVKKVMKLLAFIFEQPSYTDNYYNDFRLNFERVMHFSTLCKIGSSNKE